MNFVNRAIVSILSLALLVVSAVAVLVPQKLLVALANLFGRLHTATTPPEVTSPVGLLAARIAIGGAVILLSAFVLWLELRRPRLKTIRVQKLVGGEAAITVESISRRLAHSVDELPDVISASPRISNGLRGVDIDLLLETAPDIDIRMKTEEVLQVTKEVIVERMGLSLGKVQVKIKHAPYEKERTRPEG